MNTDRDWEKWGQIEPYFGVFSAEQYLLKNISDDAKASFFQSGVNHINHVMATCRKHFDPDFSPSRALDFGCGVGRLVVPLSGIVHEVVGVDVSISMLLEARKNCEELCPA
jgi:tRNA/tmRNA/rRNA uracil-C5-methylase (TrmA/RlmC/RlmD family)